MFFNKSKIGVYEDMWKYMSDNEESFSPSTEEGIKRVKKGDYAFLMESSSIQYQVHWSHANFDQH